MPETAQDVVRNIRDGVEKFVKGHLTGTEFDAFIKTSEVALDKLKAAKAAEDRRWFNYSTLF